MDLFTLMQPERIEAIKDAFSFFDDDNDGEIELSQVDRALRAYGLNPTLDDIQDICSDCSKFNSVNFQTFCYICYKLLRNNDVRENLILAFRDFDKDCCGMIKYDLLDKIFDSINRPLTDNQKEEITKNLIQDNGFIDYEKVVDLWMSEQ